MNIKSSRVKRFTSLFLGLIVLVTSVPIPQVQAGNHGNKGNKASKEEVEETYVAEGYEVNFKVTSQWNDGFNAEVTVTNISDTVIDNWAIGFDMPHKITNIWNGEIESEDDGYYVIKNAGHNQDINANQSVSFGFSATYEEDIIIPELFEFMMQKLSLPDEKFEVTRRVVSDWESGYNGEIKITNISDRVIEDWVLEFDYNSNITSIWNGEILSHEEDHYVIKNVGYNANILPGTSVTFGYRGTYESVNEEPTNSELYNIEEVLEENVVEEDYSIVSNAISQLNVGYAFSDTRHSVTSDLELSNSLEGATIEWFSDNTNLISNSGIVTRPSDESKSVTLTAKVSSNGYSEIKEFTLCVIKNTYENYNTDYIDDMEALELLYLYNEGNPENLEVYLNEAGYISYISGSFSDFVVESPEEAILALYGIKSLSGMMSPKEELRWVSTARDAYGTSFRFEQLYNNVPIYGKDIVVAVDNDGKTSSFNSSYTSDISLNTLPSLSEEDVKTLLVEKKYINVEDNGLNIYLHDSEPVLVWNITAIYDNNLYTVLVNAHDGNIVFTNLLSTTESANKYPGNIVIPSLPSIPKIAAGKTSASGTSSLGSNENFSVAYFTIEDSTYYMLKDVDRQITIYDASGINTNVDLPGKLIYNSTNKWTGGEVSAIANVAKAYDFYYENYGHQGKDGNNSPIGVSINYEVANAFSRGNSGDLVFGGGGSYIYGAEAALDTVGHEYTHSVIKSLTSLGSHYHNATGAISEGYADIFGYFIENDDDPEWRHREDNTKGGKGIRNMSNPGEFGQPSAIGDNNYYDFTIPGNTDDRGGVHRNNTIVSHACYLMWANGISDKGRLADLWYHSLILGYDGDSSFYTVRRNVLTAAKDMRMSADEIAIIKSAFDAVGITGLTQADINGTNILTGKVVIADADTTLGNNQALSGASISLTRVGVLTLDPSFPDNYKIAVSEEDGTFSIINILPGYYKLTVSKDGYYTTTQFISLPSRNINNYCSTIELIPSSYVGVGTAQGKVVDSVTGTGVEGLSLDIRKGINSRTGTVIETLTTGVNGTYTVDDLESGHYCIEVIDKRDTENKKYITTYFNIKILGGRVIPNQNATVSTALNASQLRIVLDWGAYPRDLDSHLLGPTSSGNEFHVYYGRKSYTESEEVIADLDLDDTSGYGPETTTIYNPIEGTYTFYIYNYTGSPAMSTSGASVRVYTGNSNVPAYVFNIPLDTTGRYWTVFSYNSKTRKITPVNVVGNSVVR